VKSWQTTLAGLAALGGAILLAVAAHFDGDPATTPNWEAIYVAAMAAVGLVFARDNNKSSESVGAK
jgi:peptidoglycan/LPS O-acetylase OafA/YrhL